MSDSYLTFCLDFTTWLKSFRLMVKNHYRPNRPRTNSAPTQHGRAGLSHALSGVCGSTHGRSARGRRVVASTPSALRLPFPSVAVILQPDERATVARRDRRERAQHSSTSDEENSHLKHLSIFHKVKRVTMSEFSFNNLDDSSMRHNWTSRKTEHVKRCARVQAGRRRVPHSVLELSATSIAHPTTTRCS